MLFSSQYSVTCVTGNAQVLIWPYQEEKALVGIINVGLLMLVEKKKVLHSSCHCGCPEEKKHDEMMSMSVQCYRKGYQIIL